MKTVDVVIRAESEDDFDEICDRAEALQGKTVEVRSGDSRISLALITQLFWNDETLEVTISFSQEALDMLNVCSFGRDALAEVEIHVLH